MRTLYPLGIIYIVLALSGCANYGQSNNPASCEKNPHPCSKQHYKNPLTISFYNKHRHPKQHFQVIGEESISKFNTGGIKRQEAHIRDEMRELAAAMGGDAVIDIKHDDKSISGTVVAFQENKSSEQNG